MTKKLSHLDDAGHAHMVDVTDKTATQRLAIAEGYIKMAADTLQLVKEDKTPKGDVLAAARLAGIMAAKKTPDLIPLCHPLLLSSVKVEFELDDALPGIRVKSRVKLSGQTGVEMEALTAVSVATLTLYDMLKAVDKSMVIGGIQLLEKTGGKSGSYKLNA
ncbi:MAG: cyclic pyranopterin monophosphate synthase MoaC [Sphingomonadales bacterium]|jgi:cyclic pyranopterin phosphate synthase